MQKSGASSSGPPPTYRDIESENAEVFSTLVNLLPEELLIISPTSPNGPHTPVHPLLAKSLEFQASLVADLVYTRKFDEKKVWNRCIAVYMAPWLGDDGSQFAEAVCSHFFAIDQVIYFRQTVQRRSNY